VFALDLLKLPGVAAGVLALAFSPLASRLTTAIRPAQAADLSGLILTASLLGHVTGVAAFVGLYLSAAPHGSAHALAITTEAIAAALVLAAGGAHIAARERGVNDRYLV
jgi:hypothetical protein